jgi:hypothetical protein
MFEYASVSASAYDTTSLVAKINEQASSGWEVVTIVATGGDVTAFLKREATDDGSTNGDVAVAEVIAVSEPAGWAAEPTPEPEPIPDVIPPDSITTSDTAFIEATTVEPAPVAASAPASSVPAGWHPDPSKRYEMRYWDGEKWTEYVSSQGQTYTDPPVA